jgi:flagellar hook-length control protein FliK
LYQQFNEVSTLLNDVKGDILAELGITEEELLTTLEQLNPKNLVDDTAIEVKANVSSTVPTKDPQVIEAAAKETVLTNVDTKDETSLKQDKTVTDVAKEITNVTTNKVNTDTSTTQDGSEQQLTGNKEEMITKKPDTLELSDTVENDFHQYVLGQGKQENVINNNLENVVPMNQKPTIDIESIVKQIQNQIKVTANMDTTKLEFQLNPEHLGKLTIQIASKEGTVTAQIAAQNLAVKEVIESQIVQLRENMNNQGLKVDAVEVTVESHEFERNLEEGNGSANQEQLAQHEKNGRRQLNYNDLTTLEDLTDEEALIAEMMIGNGNSINYTA